MGGSSLENQLFSAHRSSPPAAWRACCAAASGWRPGTSSAPAECFWRGPPPGRAASPVAPEKLAHRRSNSWWGSLQAEGVDTRLELDPLLLSVCACILASVTAQALSRSVSSHLNETFFQVQFDLFLELLSMRLNVRRKKKMLIFIICFQLRLHLCSPASSLSILKKIQFKYER